MINLTEYDRVLHDKISRKKVHQEAMKKRSRMHLVNNVKSAHISYSKPKDDEIDEELKEHLATSKDMTDSNPKTNRLKENWKSSANWSMETIHEYGAIPAKKKFMKRAFNQNKESYSNDEI